MAEQKRYLLRSTSGLATGLIKRPVYLSAVRKGGLETRWIPHPALARKFTDAQRVALESRFPHVIGRWVREKTAVAQFMAHADGVEESKNG